MMKEEVTRKTCLHCGHEFTYKERFQSSYRLFWRMYCKECGTRYSALVRYRLAFAVLLALPVAFGPSMYNYLGWGVWNVLSFVVLYFTFLLLPALFAVPLLPVKLDPNEEEDPPLEKERE